jgi:hypothetical protein
MTMGARVNKHAFQRFALKALIMKFQVQIAKKSFLRHLNFQKEMKNVLGVQM